MGGKCKCMRLSALAFGVSLGVITGLSMMFFAWSGWLWGYGASMVDQWASVYPGFGATFKGGFLGLAWGFLEGFILGVVWAWVYNLCLCCCRCCTCCNKVEVVETSIR
jgi:hypothetical protein